MRLQYQQEKWIPQFTQVWEVEFLAEQGDTWIPFCRVGEQKSIGSIHAQTHEVRLDEGTTLTRRQVVALALPGYSAETGS
jgi:hypothetical protein